MDDLTTRAYTDGDPVAIACLMNAIEVAANGDAFFTASEIRGTVSAEIQDPERDTRLVHASGGALAAAGMVAPPPPGGSQADAEGGVHPRWRGRGIGRALLAWQLERAAELRAEQNPDAAWTVHTGASVADESAARLFQRFGLRPVRYFVEMTAPTADPPAAMLPAGIRIAEYTSDMRTAVYEAHMEAFADHWGFQRRAIDKWAVRTMDSELFRGDLSRIALDGGQVAAYLLAYDGPDNRLYIGQVGTCRRWRKQGLATALLTESLVAAAEAGKTTASLGVNADSPTGAVAVYERLGFTVQHAPFAAYEKVLAR